MLRLLTCCVFGLLLLLSARCGSSGSETTSQDGLLHRQPDSPSGANDLARRLNYRGCELRNLNDFDSAMVYFRRALQLGEQYRLKRRVYASLLGIAVTYGERPHRYRRFNYEADMDSAETYFQLAYALCRDSAMTKELPTLLCEMATAIQRNPEHYERADSLFRKARRLARLENSIDDEGFVLFQQAQLHAWQAVAATDLAALKASMLLLDTAAILLHQAGKPQLAGSAEALAEDGRVRITLIEEELRRAGRR